MTQSKTSLILNNLVELTIPTCTDSKYLTFSENKEMGCLCVKLCFPFTFLLQKVQLEESHKESAKLFNIEMITKHAVTHGQMRTIVHETEIIDFKKEKIDWRFKTRMRSNSNEFLESPMAFIQKMPKGDGQYLPTPSQQSAVAADYMKKGQEAVDSEDLSILSSDEEFELKQDGKITILGNGVSNQFTLYLSMTSTNNKDDEQQDATLLTPSSADSKQMTLAKTLELFRLGYPHVRLFVWPTFRLPTGSSVIALINTSFLFATKRLEQERLEAEFLAALSLISGRKFIQASEKLRKIQSCLLSHQISVKTLIQAMNIEMIIGESMNQHSQISEKMFAFQRAVLFYKSAKRVEKHDETKNPGDNTATTSIVDIDQMINARNKTRLKQEEAYKYLLKLQPHLVQVLLLNIDSHIQAVRMASLKTLEFLFDTLGCNLDESLLQILVAIIKTYPSMTKRSNVPKDGKVISFFEDSWQMSSESDLSDQQNVRGTGFTSGVNPAPRSSLNRFSPEQLGDPSQYSTFFSLNDIHSLKDCQVKDASLFHQSFIQTSKNFYNHILESLVFLIGSTSTPILVRIFNEIISKVLFQESIEPDLQIYLLRLSEKILTLCQGYVTVTKPFLNTLFDLILQKNSAEVTGIAARGLLANSAGPGEDSIAKVANDLWQTVKSSYLLNQSCNGITEFIHWVVLQFNGLTEKVTSTSTSGSSNKDTNSDFATSNDLHRPDLHRTQAQLRDATLTVIDQQKLLLLIDLSNLLIYGQLRQMKASRSKDRKSTKRNLQKITGRETLNDSFGSEASDDQCLWMQNNGNGPNNNQRQNYQSQRISSQSKLIALKMCQLIDPVIFWLNFTIERPDRLNYFKALWNTLTKLVQIIPKRKEIGIEFNCIQIILPTLQRVESFCKTSSPSLEMLQFLIVVFSDIKSFLLSHSRKRIKKELFSFLESFISTFSQNIPHNLHDEVFEVCSLLIDLAGYNGFLKQKHIREILEALVHKYTMRSKAHKRLSDQFLQTWILNHSLAQYEDLKKLEYQLVDQQFQQQQQMHQVQQQQLSSRLRTNSNNQISSSRHNPMQFAPQPQQQQQQPAATTDENNLLIEQQNAQNSQSDDEEDQIVQQQFQGYSLNNQAHPSPAAQQLQPHQHTGSMESLNDQQQVQEQTIAGGGATAFQNQSQPQRSYSQPSNFLRHANLAAISVAGMTENNESTQANENGSNRVNKLLIEQQKIQQHLNEVQAQVKAQSLYFDTLCEFSLFKNFQSQSDQFISEQDQEQIYFEKLSVLQDLIEALKEEHNSLFKRLLHHEQFNQKLASIFSNDRARSKIIKLMKSMTGYFIKYNSPKTFYEHPIVQTSALPMHHGGGIQQVQPQQTSARQFPGNVIERAPGSQSVLQFGHQLHSEPSIDLLRVMNQEDDVGVMNRRENGAINNDRGGEQLHTSTQEQIREQDLNLQRLNHHYSQHFERQQNFLFNFNHNEAEEGESPRLAPSNMNMYLFDEVNLINNERLILIQTYTILTRIYMEHLQAESCHYPSSQSDGTGAAGKDSQSQLQALNMMDMLLFSLCPMPTFQNTVIRNLLNPESAPIQGGGANPANNNGSGDFPYQIAQPHRLSFQFTGLNSMLGSQMGISNNYEHQNDAIPDFETMLICEELPVSFGETQAPIEPNSFPKEFECWDIRYQHSRLALAFKVWPFVENAMFSSSWNNIKAACYSVLSKVVQIPDVTQMSANYQKRLKELLFPLLNKLLKSQESEGKAAGLNILGSFCGLSSFQAQSYKQSFEFSHNQDSSYVDIVGAHASQSQNHAVFDSEQGQDYHYDRYEQRQKEALSRNQIKVKDHLHVFRRNSTFVSLAIWQEVFEMQQDWNQEIREAAEVLTQLCAPKDSVKHFKNISEEKHELQVSEALNQLKHLYANNKNLGRGSKAGQIVHPHMGYTAGYTQTGLQGVAGRTQFNSQSVMNGFQGHNADILISKQNSQQQLMSAHAGGGAVGPQGNFSQTMVQFNQDFNMMNDAVLPQTGRGSSIAQINHPPDNKNLQNQKMESSSSDSEEESEDGVDQMNEVQRESDIFFMENFTEKQLQQVISLFNADFRPITGLQAERTYLASRRVKSSKYRGMNSLGGQSSTGHGIGSSALLSHEEDYLLFGDNNHPQSNLLIDFFEDNMLEEVASMEQKEDYGLNQGKGALKDNQVGSISDRHQTTSQSDGEDLGIIDLDKQEGSEYDDFDQLDDEKLPVLKNTYSKKNRPNNSKSVAIGSRSQGDVLRIRSQALQVLKAADEEIKVQIQEHPEMLSSLQRSFASQKSHEKNMFKTDLLHDRKVVKRCLDDQNLHQSLEWLSSKSESADRIYKKRRIQSGKASSCLSEDQLSRGHHSNSQYSKTDSSNGMEIGDIQIVMQHQMEIPSHYNINYNGSKKQSRVVESGAGFMGRGGQRLNRNGGERGIGERGLFYREKRISEDYHEIRSQDNRKKHKAGKRPQNNAQINKLGDLSENDANEKISSSDQDVGVDRADNDEYEVISAPVKRTIQTDIRANQVGGASFSAYKLSTKTGKMSIDSLTELSSPFDEGSSTKTLPASANKFDEEETKRKSVSHLKTGKAHSMASKIDGNSQVKSSQVCKNKNQSTIYTSSLQKVSLLSGQQQPQTHNSSNFLQTVVAGSKQTQKQGAQANSQIQAQLNGAQKQLSMNKMQSSHHHQNHQSVNQSNSKFLGKEVVTRSKQQTKTASGVAGSTAIQQQATFNQSQLKLIQGKDNRENHHQQQPSIQTTKSSNRKQNGQQNNVAAAQVRNTRNNGAAANQAVVLPAQNVKDKRPNSLVVKHMPQQSLVQKMTGGITAATTTKRNNFIVQSPRGTNKLSNTTRLVSTQENQTATVNTMTKTTINSQRQQKQADQLTKYSKLQQPATAADPSTKKTTGQMDTVAGVERYVSRGRQDAMPANNGDIEADEDVEEDPVEDLL